MEDIPRVVLLLETSRAFGRDLLYGIAKYSRLHGPWAFYREPGGLTHLSLQIGNWDAHGVIMRDSVMAKHLMSLGLPTILALHKQGLSDHYHCIVTNSEAIGNMAAEYFLHKGFTNFAFCGFDHINWSQLRCKSFKERVSQAGFITHVYKQPKSRSKRSWNSEQKILADWLSGLPRPLALMACNDDRAHHAIEACKLAKIAVPDEIAILGVDNDELVCDLAYIPLSSIALDTKAAGYRAAKLLDKLMHGEKEEGQQILVQPTHIVTRQSTDILAISDPDVSAAIRLIRQNAKKAIQVDDIVNATAVSRRVLEKRFRKLLNHSIYQEIRRVRTEHCIKLLLETDMSVSEIVTALDFPGIEHIARYFRKETGMSLMSYRKKYAFR